MKKLFLTLIVTMLTCIGAWAQDEGKPLAMEVGQTLTIYGYHFNSGGTYGPDVIKWEKGDNSNGSVNLVSIEELTGTITTAKIGDGQVQITANSACTNVPVRLYFERIITIYEASNNYAGTPTLYEKGVVTFLISAKGNTCTWSYNGSEWISASPIQITMDKTDDAKLFEFTTSWEENDNQSQIVSVQSSNTDAVSITEFNNGKSFKINSNNKGEADITVTAKCGNQTDKRIIHVIVNDKTLATSLSLPSSANVAKGYSTVLDVDYEPSTANDFTVSVEPTDGGVSAYLSSDFKKLTIQAIAAPTSTEYAVTIKPKNGSSAEAATVNVTVIEPVSVSAVSFENESITLAKGTKANVVATVTPSNAANTDVNYVVADNTVISYNNGVLTALKHGTTTITATSAMDDTKTDVLTVNVTDQLPVILGKPKNRYVVGTVYDADLTVGDDLVLGMDYTASYSSSNPTVLSVDEHGTFTAHKVGTTKISVVYTPTVTGTAKGYTEWSNFLDITVDKGKFDLSASAAKNSLDPAENTTITPAVKLNGSVADAALYTISYSSDNDDVEVSDAGLVTVKSDATQGTAHITVTLTPTNTADYETASVDVLIAYGYNATGSGAIATLASDGFVELFIPSPGAYGTVTPAQYSGYDITRAYSVGSDELLRNAKKIRITGYISNEDVQAFSNLVGGHESKVTDLDMGGAKMSEAITETLPTSENWNISFLAPGFRNSNANVLSNVQNFVMPQPADNSTVIPANFVKWFKDNGLKLQSVEITHGWTEVGDGAFSTGGNVDAAGLVLSSVKFPNTLEVIGEYAFSGHRFTTLTLPKTITELKSGAFETKKPNTLKDVYFLGEYAPIVDKDAFATITHIANNSFVHPRNFKYDDIYNYNQCVRENYYDEQNGWCAKLHYPASLLEPGKEHLRALYEDPYRVYSCTNRYELANNTSTHNASNKANGPLVEGDMIVLDEDAAFGSVSNFASKIQSADFCGGMTINSANEIEPGFYDKAIGDQYVWPSQQQFLRAYGSTRNGYFYTGVEMDEEQKQRIGLYEFIFTDPDVNNESTTGWTFTNKYEQDLWWTICVPFNMSVEQIKAVFGPNTEVCRFSRVVRTLGEDGTVGKLRLEFKNSVMGEIVEGADGNPVNWGTGNADGSLGILAHHPYMIYPSGETEALYKLDGKRYFPNYTIVDGDVTGETITAVDLAETPNPVEVNKPYDVASNASETGYIHKDSQPARYTFIGNYMNVNVPQYAYYLGLNNSVERSNPNYHQFYFNNASTPLAFNPYTCVVYNNFGEYDNHDYFNGADPETALAKSIFGVEMDDDFEATGVKNIEIVCGNNNDNKVYNLKGQLVNGNLENLPSGVYIVNGKKYIK